MNSTLFTNAKLADGALVDLTVTDGRFSTIKPARGKPPEAAADPTATDLAIIDLGGQLVVPGFVEGHIHLDTSFHVYCKGKAIARDGRMVG